MVQASKKQEAKNLPERWAFEMGRDLFDTLRMRQQLSACNLERFISEVITRFNSRPEERLYNVVYTLLQRCLRLPRPQSADVPDDMKRELQNVCDACLAHEMQASGRRRGMPVEMRQSFVNDVQPSTKTSLRSLMESLKVRSSLTQRTLPLSDMSVITHCRRLANFSVATAWSAIEHLHHGGGSHACTAFSGLPPNPHHD